MEGGSKPPRGYVSLDEAMGCIDKCVNIMGVVKDLLPPTQSNGTDHMMRFELVDESCPDGLMVRYFQKPLALPKIGGIGDVVILEFVKIKNWQGLTMALSCHATQWTVFASDSIPEKPSSGHPQQLKHQSSSRLKGPSPAQCLYAISLCNLLDRSTFIKAAAVDNPDDAETVTAVARPTSQRKFSLIKEVEVDRFYDLVGEVVKIFPCSTGGVNLYITDYTSNELLFDYGFEEAGGGPLSRDGDEHGYISSRRPNNNWTGPYGKQTLLVFLHPPHSTGVGSTVKVGAYVFLRNVRVRANRDGSGLLEGVLYTDRRDPNKIDVTVLKEAVDDRAKAVLRRKRDYHREAKKDKGEFGKMIRNQRKRAAEELDDRPDDGQPKTAPAKKGKKKRKAHAADDRKDAAEASAAVLAIKATRATEPNKNIRSNHPSIRTLPVAEILNGNGHEVESPKGVKFVLPFHNVCCRARVRVVDFFPPDLADFAVPYRESQYDALSDDEGESSTDESDASIVTPSNGSRASNGVKWEWRFCLLLEDGNAKALSPTDVDHQRIQALVADHDAEYLLKLDAQDLRKNEKVLAQLRERLCLLWGDLEERKTAAAAQGPPVLQDKAPNKMDKARGGDGQDKEATCAVTKKPSPALKGVSNKVFECCLKEYGVPVRKADSGKTARRGSDADDTRTWERRFRMFGTTIMYE